MSYIRALEVGEWEDIETGLYCYRSKEVMHGVPRRPLEFIEVVMRMLDQSGEFEEETLTEIHEALRKRILIEDELAEIEEPGRRDVTQEAYER